MNDQVKHLTLNDTGMDEGIASMNTSLVIDEVVSVVKEEAPEEKEWKALMNFDWFEESEKEDNQPIPQKVDAPATTDLLDNSPRQVGGEPQKRIVLEGALQ